MTRQCLYQLCALQMHNLLPGSSVAMSPDKHAVLEALKLLTGDPPESFAALVDHMFSPSSGPPPQQLKQTDTSPQHMAELSRVHLPALNLLIKKQAFDPDGCYAVQDKINRLQGTVVQQGCMCSALDKIQRIMCL